MKAHVSSLLIIPAILLFSPTVGCGFTTPDARVVLQVHDESGEPVAGATVSVAGVFHEVPGSTAKGITDTNGLYTATVRSQGSIATFAEKQGYYRTVLPEIFLNQGRENSYENALLRGKWLPWGATNTIVLKRVVNPIGMLAGGGDRFLPGTQGAYGYDLEVHDWVAPHGRGKNSDLLLEMQGEVKDDRNFWGQLRLSFARPLDGIIQVPYEARTGSELRLPREATLDGYGSEWLWSVSYGSLQRSGFPPPVDPSKTSVAYVFRVRTELDEQGKIKKAYYGCIVGELIFDPRTDRGGGFLRFNYYLNPTPNDRNLERDPEKQALSLKP
jgi:hypothetical protein